MDPLTRTAQEFARQLAEAWRGTGPVRLVAPERHRSYVLRSLRVFEWAPENRWPLCVVELPPGDVEGLARAVRARVIAELAELRRGLAEDGVVVAEPSVGDVSGDAWQRLQAIVEGAGEVLARTGAVAGLALALVPEAQVDRRTVNTIAERLRAWPERAHVRVALWSGEDELAEAMPAAARFELDEAAVHDFCRAQGERQAGAAPPAEAAIHRELLVAAEAARHGDMPAARRAYEAAAAGLVGLGKRAEAAVVQIALGGMSFGLGDRNAALVHFDRAAADGEALGDPRLAAQAHLGAAGVLFAGGSYAEAAARYRAAAGGGPEALRIEALRMAGVAHAKLGEREAAALAWQDAVDCANGMPAATRGQTSWRLAGEALLAVLQRRGSMEQHEHLRAMMAADGEAEHGRGG